MEYTTGNDFIYSFHYVDELELTFDKEVNVVPYVMCDDQVFLFDSILTIPIDQKT